MDRNLGKLAIFGGSFNPVHLGHLHAVESVLRHLEYNSVVVVPSYVPPHKRGDPTTSHGHRVEMLKLASEPFNSIIIDTCEIEREGVSYTIDTVEDIRNRYVFSGKPGLIIGDDLLFEFHTWRRVDELIRSVDLIVARRMSGVVPSAYPYISVDNRIFTASSSDIRMRVKEGLDIADMVPGKVADYIQTHSLYR